MTPTVWTVVGQYPTGDTFVEFAAAPTPAEAGRQAVAQINARNGYDYEDTDIAMLAVFHGEQRDCLPSPRAVLGLTPTATPPANAAGDKTDRALAALTTLSTVMASWPPNFTDVQRRAALGVIRDWWNHVAWPVLHGEPLATLYTVIIVTVAHATVDYEVQLCSSRSATWLLLNAATGSEPYQDPAGWLVAHKPDCYAVGVPTALTLTAAQRPHLARLRARLAEMDLARAGYREGSVEYDELYAEQNAELAGELRSLLDGLLPD